MPVQVLRRRVDDHVAAERERLLEVGRRKRVVDDDAELRPVLRRRLSRERGERGEVGDLHRRVRRRLDEEHPRIRSNGASYRVEVRRVDVVEGHPEIREYFREKTISAAVRVAADEDVVPGGRHRQHQRRRGGHARGEGVPARAPFERGEKLFEGEARRVLRPRVLVAGARPAEGFLDVRRRLEDGHGDGARHRLGLLSRVNAERREAAPFLLFLFHHRGGGSIVFGAFGFHQSRIPLLR